MWSNRLDVIRRDGDDQSEDDASSASASSTLSSTAIPPVATSITSALIVQLSITTEERAKLFSGLMKILGRKLPAFPGLAQPSRGQLSFREFVKGVSGRGFLEAKKLVRLVKACRRGCPMPGERTGTGQIDLAAADALSLTAQLCLGVASAHGRAKTTSTDLLEDGGLVHWALQQWETNELSGKLALLGQRRYQQRIHRGADVGA
mmetsp:Transcript_12247/g.29666  ORF Transcript_12247/g.29666 Transcript_12247/m.29666 type:complete len:205 (+) Transcript_12247:1101-1715(+)